MKKNWCGECTKAQLRYRAYEEAPTLKIRQDLIFNDARLKLLNSQSNNRYSTCSCKRSGKCRECQRITGLKKSSENEILEKKLENPEFEVINKEIKKLADMYTFKWLENMKSSTTCTLEQIQWVYRVSLYPERVFQFLLFQHGKDQAKTNFRKLVILLHPDKNGHPGSAKAFKKLLKVYETCK